MANDTGQCGREFSWTRIGYSQSRPNRNTGAERRLRFSPTRCEFFPCHTGIDPDEFNCLFCYCPFTLGDKCGGRFTYINDIKDCSNCVVPHRRGNYGYITGRFNEIVEAMREIKRAAP